MFDYMGAISFCAMVLPMWTTSSPKGVQKNHMAAPVKVARQQTIYTSTHRNPPEPSGTCLRNLHQPSGTFRNLPPEPTPAHAGTFGNLPESASGTYTSTRRNSPEPSGTFLGTCSCSTGAHRSLSGLKTPLAYAVGGKQIENNTTQTAASVRHRAQTSVEVAPADSIPSTSVS